MTTLIVVLLVLILLALLGVLKDVLALVPAFLSAAFVLGCILVTLALIGAAGS